VSDSPLNDSFSIPLTPLEQDTGSVDPQKMEMAVAELDMITDVLYVSSSSLSLTIALM
jgi:hypothetical protein